MSETLLAWAVLIGGFVLPVFHVALSANSGPWRPPPGSRCPLGPRVGWLVMVLLLGPIGWLLYLSGRTRRRVRAPNARPEQAPDERGPPPNA